MYFEANIQKEKLQFHTTGKRWKSKVHLLKNMWVIRLIFFFAGNKGISTSKLDGIINELHFVFLSKTPSICVYTYWSLL